MAKTGEEAITEEKKGKRERISWKQYIKERVKNIPFMVIWSAFALYCVATFIYFIAIGRGRDSLISVAYFLIVPLICFIEKTLNVRCPIVYTIFLALFILFCHLGACFNFYYIIPCLDDILHACWGIVFSVVGIVLIKGFLGPAQSKKAVIMYVLFGLGFAMLLSVIWEIWEFTIDRIYPNMDMQQDTIVNQIESFMMYPNPQNPSPDNQNTWKVYEIAQTVLYDADGNVIGTIDGGYLDTGLWDTMMDLIFCFGFVAVFSVILSVDWCGRKFIYKHFIPELVSEKSAM